LSKRCRESNADLITYLFKGDTPISHIF